MNINVKQSMELNESIVTTSMPHHIKPCNCYKHRLPSCHTVEYHYQLPQMIKYVPDRREDVGSISDLEDN